MSMQLMAMLKEQNRKLDEFSAKLVTLNIKIDALVEEVADQAEHVAGLIEPRRATPGRVNVKQN